jgi:hypothetical protein
MGWLQIITAQSDDSHWFLSNQVLRAFWRCFFAYKD